MRATLKVDARPALASLRAMREWMIPPLTRADVYFAFRRALVAMPDVRVFLRDDMLRDCVVVIAEGHGVRCRAFVAEELLHSGDAPGVDGRALSFATYIEALIELRAQGFTACVS